MSNIYLLEDWINRAENCGYGNSGVYESWATEDDVGRLFHELQKEHGRCIGKMYVEGKSDTQPKHIGWVFQKREKYTDTKQPYILETWISLHKSPEKRYVDYDYMELG